MGTPSQPARAPRVTLGRRSTLAALVGGAAALSGCSTGSSGGPGGSASSLRSGEDSPSPGLAGSGSASDDASPSASVAETADRTRVRMALEKTEAMLAGVLALRETPAIRGLASLHTAHRTALQALLEEAAPPSSVPAPPLTRAELPLREAGLQAELVAASLAAEDGLVARVLASMSAGVAQQLAALPAGGTPRPGPRTTPSASGAEA